MTKRAAANPSTGWDEGEPVTVNTRALIDKVLARYSSEHTSLRELCQNAADAGAKNMVFRFESGEPEAISDEGLIVQQRPGLADVKVSDPRPEKQKIPPQETPIDYPSLHHSKFASRQSFEELVESLSGRLFQRLIVKNDGEHFKTLDWERVKRIADGNPDENKIGAFGVGFYSVFSECDEPVIHSGNKAMAFFWKGNQLCVKTRNNESETPDPWTTIDLPYRSPVPLPEIHTLIKFFVTSITFVGLESISLFINEVKIFVVDKRISSPSHDMLIPPGFDQNDSQYWPSNREVKMDIETLECTSVAMRASYLRGIIPSDSSSIHPFIHETASMRIWTAHIKTEVSKEVADEVTRASLKSPPTRLKISMLSADGDTAGATRARPQGDSSVFCYVVPGTVSEEAPGRVWIGFRTQQTTGFGAHLNTHSVIPTVERENIDFNARHVKTWNVAAMHAAGILARIMCHHDIQELVESPEKETKLVRRMGVIMQRYAFTQSAPIPTVGENIKDAFFKTSFNEMLVLSTQGFVKVGAARLGFQSDYSEHEFRPSSCLVKFAFLHPVLVRRCQDFVANLKALGMLKQVSVEEICGDLKGRVLDNVKARYLMEWAASKLEKKELQAPEVKRIVNSLSVTVPEYDPAVLDASLTVAEGMKLTRQLEVSSVKTFISKIEEFYPSIPGSNGNRHLYLPRDCIPLELIDGCFKPEQRRVIFGWEQLDIVRWTTYLVSQNPSSESILGSSIILQHILFILFSYWRYTSASDKSKIKELLQSRPCIPTRANKGILKPCDVYVPSVNSSLNIAIFNGGSYEASIKERFLIDIGLRTFVKLETVLESFMSKGPEAQPTTSTSRLEERYCYQIVEHILSCNEKVPEDEMESLKKMKFCISEDYKGYGTLFKPSDLFEPEQRLRDLGLPILKYPANWVNVPTPQRAVLKKLGVRSYPKLGELAKIAADLTCTHERREDALKYFIERMFDDPLTSLKKVKLRHKLRRIAFLPIELSLDYRMQHKYDERTLRKPQEIYLNPHCSILGFPVLRFDLKPIGMLLETQMEPNDRQLVSALKRNPPESIESAITIFDYLDSSSVTLGRPLLTEMGSAEIVPVLDSDQVCQAVRKVRNKRRGNSTIIHRIIGGSQVSITLLRPNRIFLGTPKPEDPQFAIARFFDWVDFGERANRFLTQCGAETKLSDSDVAEVMVRDSQAVLGNIGQAEYKLRLKYLAMTYKTVKEELSSSMRNERWLLGVKAGDNSKPGMKGNEDGEQTNQDPTIPAIQLASPSQIMIMDDLVSHRLYARHILTCPEDDVLEKFYHELGSSKLSRRVAIKYLVTAASTPGAIDPPNVRKMHEEMRDKIIKRATLFFHEYKAQSPRYNMKQWFKDFRVVTVTKIKAERTLTMDLEEPINVVMETKAAVPKEGLAGGGHGKTLCIVPGGSFFDMAEALLQTWMANPKVPEIYAFEAFLRLGLEILQNRGVNVKRILRNLDEEEAELPIAESNSHLDSAAGPTQNPPALKMNPVLPMTPPADPPKPKEVRKTRRVYAVSLRSELRSPEATENVEDSNQTLDLREKSPEGTVKAGDRPMGLSSSEIAAHNDSDDELKTGMVPAKLATAATSGKVSISPQSGPPPPDKANLDKPIPHGSYNLTYHAVSATGQSIFLEEGSTEEKEQLFSSYKTSFEVFGDILGTISEVFGFDKATPNMFITRSEGSGSSKSEPAFHREGSIFFNLRTFNELHFEEVKINDEPTKALIYWFMAMCNVCAFQLSKDPADHSRHLAALATEFWIPMCGVLRPSAIYPDLPLFQTTHTKPKK